MRSILVLRLDAPLMSFGGMTVDSRHPTNRFPGVSFIAGLLGNALGYRYTDFEELRNLQDGIEYAARWDVEPVALSDYQTADLSQKKMQAAWTPAGEVEWRGGSDDAANGTHPMQVDYWADGVMTLTIALSGLAGVSPEQVAAALEYPARPLYLGRKTCLPAAPLMLSTVEATDVLSALQTIPLADHPKSSGLQKVSAVWPRGLGVDVPAREVGVFETRDWENRTHTGKTWRMQGKIEVIA